MRREAVNAEGRAVRAIRAACGALMVASLVLGFAGCAAFPPLGRRKEDAEAEARRVMACQELSKAAQAAMDSDDNATAEGLLRQLVGLDPKSAEAQHRLGRVLQSEGRDDEAALSFARALELDHEYVAAMIGLGTIDLARGRAPEALRRFDSAVDFSPHHADAHLGRAESLELMGRPEEALAAYFRALEFAPNSVPARLRVAALQLDRQEPEQALARLDVLVEQNADDGEARLLRGRARLVLNHVNDAVADLTLAAERLPDRADVHYHLALALSAAHKDKAALEAVNQALRLAPDYADARDLTEKLLR